MKCDPSNTDIYFQFLCNFGPAMTGMSFWNNNKMSKSANELLTISDEAFIHLCIINYSATWKAQEKRKERDHTVKVLVSIVYCLANDALS
jgi:tryptophanyl-tRNA synthetase